MLPFKIYTRKRIFNYYTGLSFFIFIWISRLTKDEERLVRHEKIHFLQQIELLFIFHWILYAFFYIVARSKGHGHYAAYRHNPFELEAYAHERDSVYLKTRKSFAWINYIKEYNQVLLLSPPQPVPAHFRDSRFRLPIPASKVDRKRKSKRLV